MANNKNSVPTKGCKGICLKWHTKHYGGRHNVVNAFAEGKVGCYVCEILFDKSHVKNGKFCKCCGKQVRFKSRSSVETKNKYEKSLEEIAEIMK